MRFKMAGCDNYSTEETDRGDDDEDDALRASKEMRHEVRRTGEPAF